MSGSEEELEDVKPRVKSTAGRGTKRKINAVSRDEEIRILLSIPDEQESVSDSELSEEEVKPTKTTPRQKAMASKLIGTDSKSSTPRAAFSKVRLSSWQPGLRLRQGTKANKPPSKAPKKAVSVRPDRLLPLTSLGPPLFTSSRAYTTGSSLLRPLTITRTDLARFTYGQPFITISASQGQRQGRVRPFRPVFLSQVSPSESSVIDRKSLAKAMESTLAALRRWW